MSQSSSTFPAAWPRLANLVQAALPQFLLNRQWYPAKDLRDRFRQRSRQVAIPGMGSPWHDSCWVREQGE